MALLGERNWYFPKWLRRLPDLTHDESPAAVAVAAVTPKAGASQDDEGDRVPV